MRIALVLLSVALPVRIHDSHGSQLRLVRSQRTRRTSPCIAAWSALRNKVQGSITASASNAFDERSTSVNRIPSCATDLRATCEHCTLRECNQKEIY